MSDSIKDLLWSVKKNKKAQALLAIIAGLVIVAIVLVIMLSGSDSENNDAETNAEEQTGETTETTTLAETAERRIDGVEVDGDESNRLPVAIVVENLRSVRPQSGLGSANIVYETLAEGGITRFMAVYASDENVDPIGPIRSARHYFVDWAEEYGGLYAHVGGSPQALGILDITDYMTDLNQFAYSQYYYRDNNLFAPHNVFSTSELMQFAVRDLELSEAVGEYEPFLFKEPTEKTDRPTSVDPIVIDFSNDAYAVEWEYNQDTNLYGRLNGGEVHTDANTGEQLTAANIAVQFVETSLLEADTGRIDIVTQGEGEAVVFMDGAAIEGTWSKPDRGDRTKFYDADGTEIKFNPGTTWIEAVPVDQSVTY